MNGHNGTSISSNHRRNSSRRQTHDGGSEEEIDDDEENALLSVRNGRSSDMSTPPVPTEDVISLLLRQPPVSAHVAKSESEKENNSASTPIDFSSAAKNDD